MSETFEKLKIMVVIVNRGQGEDVVKVLESSGAVYNIMCLGQGTANSDLQLFLGIGQSDKDIILTTATESKMKSALNSLQKVLEIDKTSHGIAFTLPLSSVAGATAYSILSGNVN